MFLLVVLIKITATYHTFSATYLQFTTPSGGKLLLCSLL